MTWRSKAYRCSRKRNLGKYYFKEICVCDDELLDVQTLYDEGENGEVLEYQIVIESDDPSKWVDNGVLTDNIGIDQLLALSSFIDERTDSGNDIFYNDSTIYTSDDYIYQEGLSYTYTEIDNGNARIGESFSKKSTINSLLY